MNRKLSLTIFFIFLFSLFSTIVIADNNSDFCSTDLDNSGCSVEDSSSLENTENSLLLTTNQDYLEEYDFSNHKDGQICIIYFYSDTCSHCKAIKPFIDEIENEFGDKIHLSRLNVNQYKNFQLYNEFCTENGYGGKQIPLIAISDNYYIGEVEIRDNLKSEIDRLLLEPKDELICPMTKGKECFSKNPGSENLVPDGITYGAIFVAGLIDGVNPCAFAVLLFLMTILFEMSGSKKRVLKVGISYITAFVATNIGMGLLVYWFSDLVFAGSPWPLKIAAAIALFAGLVNIKDYFWYGKGFSLKIPESTKKIYQPLIMKGSVPACIVLGFLIAIFEAPCSASIYYAVLEMLRSKTTTLLAALPFILIYNFMFILPLIILFWLVYTEKNMEVMEKWRKSKRKFMKLAMGIILVLFSIAVFFNMI